MSYRVIMVWTFRYTTNWSIPKSGPEIMYEIKNYNLERVANAKSVIPLSSGLQLTCF